MTGGTIGLSLKPVKNFLVSEYNLTTIPGHITNNGGIIS
jgi:hypothetical protein